MTRPYIGAPLTPDETTALHYAARGHTSRQIARLLGDDTTESAVSSRLKTAAHKLGAANRTHAAVIATHRRLITIDDLEHPAQEPA